MAVGPIEHERARTWRLPSRIRRLRFRHSNRSAAVDVSRPTRRRRIDFEAGRALEVLGHAIEYLADEFVHDGTSLSPDDGRLQAIQILMAANREIYFTCPEALSVRERIRAVVPSANCLVTAEKPNANLRPWQDSLYSLCARFSGCALTILVLLGTQLPAENYQSAGVAADSRPTLTFTQFKPAAPIHLVAYGDMRFTSPTVTSGTNPRVRGSLCSTGTYTTTSALSDTGWST